MPPLSPQMMQALKQLLVNHEGLRVKPYTDTCGNLTIGIGRNLSGRDLNINEVDLMFINDVDYFNQKLTAKFPWFSKLNEARQIALIDLCFCGFNAFCTFTKMISALEKEDYETAAEELLNSKHHKITGVRDDDLAKILRSGELI